MGKREEKSQETRRLLLAAAEERIRMSGYEQVSVAEITRAGDACSGLRAYLEGFADVVVQADVMQARAWVRYMLLPQDGRSKWEDDADALGALLQGLRDHGRLVHDAPVDALAVMLMTHIYGIIFLWTIHPERTVRQEVQDFCRLHLHALLAPYLPA